METNEEDETPDDPSSNTIIAIQFNQDEIRRIRQVWNKTLIIKLHGRGLNFKGANEKLAHLWKLTNLFQVMDIGEGYYVVKFYDFNDYMIVFAGGDHGFCLIVIHKSIDGSHILDHHKHN